MVKVVIQYSKQYNCNASQLKLCLVLRTGMV